MKIKDFKFLHATKLKIRKFKHFISDLVNLIKIRSNLNILLKFTFDNFKKFSNNKKLISNIYLNSYFEYPDWFQHKIFILIYYLKKNNFNNQCNLLEIGSFEGRSTLFFLYFFKKIFKIEKFYISCVDTWKGSSEEVHKKIDFKKVEKNFDMNLINNKKVVKKYKTTSKFFF